MMNTKVKVSVYRRANRKYYQAGFRLASGEWTERSTKTTNRKEATAIGYGWAEAEMKEHASKHTKKNEVEYILEGLRHDNKHMKLDKKAMLKGSAKLLGLLTRGDEASPLMTLGVWLDRWLERKLKDGLADESIRFYTATAKVIKGANCGCVNKLLMELMPEDIENLVSDIRNGNYADTRYRDGKTKIKGKTKKKPAKTTAKKRVSILKAILDSAHENGYTSNSFHQKLKIKGKAKTIPRGRFEIHELRTLVSKCEEIYAEGKCTGKCKKDACKCIEQWREWGGAIEMALQTGVRISNCIPLDWSDIDIFNKKMDLILVKQDSQDEKEISTFDIKPTFYEYLLSVKPQSKGAVFPYLASKSKERWSQLFRTRVMKLAGIKQEVFKKGKLVARRSFHSTRGSTATLMRERGVSKEVIKDILGHSCVEMTEHYITQDVTPEQRLEAFEALPDIRQIAQ